MLEISYKYDKIIHNIQNRKGGSQSGSEIFSITGNGAVHPGAWNGINGGAEGSLSNIHEYGTAGCGTAGQQGDSTKGIWRRLQHQEQSGALS